MVMQYLQVFSLLEEGLSDHIENTKRIKFYTKPQFIHPLASTLLAKESSFFPHLHIKKMPGKLKALPPSCSSLHFKACLKGDNHRVPRRRTISNQSIRSLSHKISRSRQELMKVDIRIYLRWIATSILDFLIFLPLVQNSGILNSEEMTTSSHPDPVSKTFG